MGDLDLPVGLHKVKTIVRMNCCLASVSITLIRLTPLKLTKYVDIFVFFFQIKFSKCVPENTEGALNSLLSPR